MNANELANEMEKGGGHYMLNIASTLRQLQAENVLLRNQVEPLRKELSELHTENEALKKQVIGDDYVFVCKRCGDELGIKFEAQEK